MKKKPEEWEKKIGLEIIDPDGWRFKYGKLEPKDYGEPISKEEFLQKAIPSTVQCGPSFFKKILDDPMQRDN